MIQLYVKKLTSVSPDKYGYITTDDAFRLYTEYLSYPFQRGIYKSFEGWLDTEI